MEQGLIDDADHAAVVDFAHRKQVRVEEALLQLGLIEEARLLKFVATLHRTQFVSTERMSKAKVDRNALQSVSKKLAQHLAVYPLVLDRRGDKLIVATADPDDVAAIKELKLAAGVRRVLPMVARPGAVTAAIARGYDGDRRLFAQLLRAQTGFVGTLADDDPFEAAERRRKKRRTAAGAHSEAQRPGARRRLRRTGRPLTGELRGRERAPRRSTGTGERRLDPELARGRGDRTGHPGDSFSPVPTQGRYSSVAEGRAGREPRRRMSPSASPSGPGYYDDHQRSSAPPRSADPVSSAPHSPSQHVPSPRGQRPSYPDIPYSGNGLPPQSSGTYHPHPAERRPAPTPQHGYGTPALADWREPPEPQRKGPRKRLSLLPPMRAMALAPATVGFGSLADRQPSSDVVETDAVLASVPYLESLRVLVGLLESDRAQLRAHSSAVARFSMSLCERISLPKQHTQAIVLASYLHDLGKMGSLHLTALNTALFDNHRHLATKLVAIPQQLMESVGLGSETTQALASMYEQMGGGGLPEGLSGKEIPIGARILAVADSFADLTRNAQNKHGGVLTSEAAIALMREYANTVFDANILDVLEEATGGERILTDLLANRHRVLLIDTDPEETMVLQLRMVEQGFDVHVARSLDEARSVLKHHEFALVVSEVDLEQPDEGFVLLQENASLAEGIAWVFLSGRETRETAERAFALQADDFLTKPVATEVVVAKLTQLIEKQSHRVAPHGVSGSLSQMGLPDIIQVLWHGRKTCALIVTQGDTEGAIHFSNGRIVDAVWGDATAETAVYRLLAIEEDGNFRVDPEFVPASEPVIQISPEGLLLEGMRLLDEGAIP